MHRTILVSAPAGPALQDALAVAVGLARPRGAQVLVLPRRDMAPGPAAMAAVAGPPDVPVIVADTAVAPRAEALHEAVVAYAAELLVVDQALAPQVTHHAPCAVAVAPAGAATSAPAEPRSLVVGWDGSTEAGEALEWAVQVAERTAGAVRIVHVFEHAPIGQVGSPVLRARLEETRAAAAQRVPCTAQVVTGRAAAELQRIGDADLLVLGSRDRGPLTAVVLGSVAASVLWTAACPVVVLPRGVHAPVETTV